MSELTLVEAINDCFHVELGRDENVMVMGEDVGRAGGVFRATAGLRDKFGPARCVDTPLAEARPDLAVADAYATAAFAMGATVAIPWPTPMHIVARP